MIKTIAALIVFIATSPSNAFTLNDNYKHGWNGPTLKFNVNTTNCPSNFISALKDAAELWNSVNTSQLKLAVGSTSSTTTSTQLMNFTATDSPVVICETNFGGATGSDEDSIAGVGYSTAISGAYINYGGLIVNMSNGDASFNLMKKTQMAAVLAHEMGHVLGFGHSEDSAALMYYSTGARNSLRLSQDDWDAMTYLYPQDGLDPKDLFGCGTIQSVPPAPWTGGFLLILPLMIFALLKLAPKTVDE